MNADGMAVSAMTEPGLPESGPAVPERELQVAQAMAVLSADLLRRCLPRALAMQGQLAEVAALDEDDAACLSDLVDTLARASEALGHDSDIAALHRCARMLCDEILTEAFASAGR